MMIINNNLPRAYLINSLQRIAGTSSNFSYVIPNVKEEYNRCLLQSIIIPKSYYHIKSFPTFILREGVVDTTVTMPEGNYRLSSFINVLRTRMNAATVIGRTYSITQSSTTAEDTGKITISHNGVGVGESYLVTAQAADINPLIGFPYIGTIFHIQQAGSVCPLPYDLAGENVLLLHSDIVEDINQILAVIPVNVATGSSIVYREGTVKEIKPRSANLVVNFYLTDENNKAIDLNGLDIVLTLILYKA